jgi:AcrR family transcriptional regulator
MKSVPNRWQEGVIEMAEAKTDRRVQKTRQALQNALIELILEKGYDTVMVQDILDRANVGRSTFYAHYQDKDDLLMNHLESLLKAFEAHARPILGEHSAEDGEFGGQINLPLFVVRYMENQPRLFKALLGRHGSIKHSSYFQNFLGNYILNILRSYSKAGLSPQQLGMVATYLTSAFLSLLVWWIDNDLPCSVEELYTMMLRLIEPGLKQVLEVETLWPPVS